MNILSSLVSSAAGIFSHPSWDSIIVIALFAMSFFYGITVGKRKIIAGILYLYIAYTIFQVVPSSWILRLNIGNSFWSSVIVFLLLYAILFFLLGARGSRNFVGAGGWWKVFVLSLAHVGLLLHIIFSFLPGSTIETFSPFTRTVLAGKTFDVWWFLVPILVVIFIKRLDHREE